jgi:hypothetical protein
LKKMKRKCLAGAAVLLSATFALSACTGSGDSSSRPLGPSAAKAAEDGGRATAQAAVEKVTICHIPPGNPDNRHTITIGAPAVAAHLENHGDTEGPCPVPSPSPSPTPEPGG